MLDLNNNALNSLKFEDLSYSFDCLKEAERYLLLLMQKQGSHELLCKLLSVTLNNLACYHKKKGYLRTSLKYFGQILSIEKFYLNDTTGIASTYLNVSTVLDQLNKSREALQFAKRAMVLLADQLGIGNPQQSGYDAGDDASKGRGVTIKSLMTATVNVATMYLKLGMLEQAFQVASKGIHHSRDLLGPNHYLEQRLNEIKNNAAKKLQGQYSRRRTQDNVQASQTSRRDLLKGSNYHCKDSVYDPYMRPQSAYAWEVVLSEKKGVSLTVDRVKGEISLNSITPCHKMRPKSRLQFSAKVQSSRDARMASEKSVQSLQENSKQIEYPALRPFSNKRPKDQKIQEDYLRKYKLRANLTEPRQRKMQLKPVDISSINGRHQIKGRYHTQMKPNLNTGLPSNQHQPSKPMKMEKPYDLLEYIQSRKSIDLEEKLRREDPKISVENQKLLNFDASFEIPSRYRKKSLAPIDEQSNEEMRSKELGIKDIHYEEIPDLRPRIVSKRAFRAT